jgi:hypothetical protein
MYLYPCICSAFFHNVRPELSNSEGPYLTHFSYTSSTLMSFISTSVFNSWGCSFMSGEGKSFQLLKTGSFHILICNGKGTKSDVKKIHVFFLAIFFAIHS